MMKNLIIILTSLFVVVLQSTALSQLIQNKGYFVGMFDGRTPCKELATQLDEKVSDACTKIKWRLNLYKDSETAQTGRYELQGFVYKKESPRVGRWHIIKGTVSNPNADVYRLDLEGKSPIFLQRVDNNILFFLDEEKNLMIGNRDFSYTLNRMK